MKNCNFDQAVFWNTLFEKIYEQFPSKKKSILKKNCLSQLSSPSLLDEHTWKKSKISKFHQTTASNGKQAKFASTIDWKQHWNAVSKGLSFSPQKNFCFDQISLNLNYFCCRVCVFVEVGVYKVRIMTCKINKMWNIAVLLLLSYTFANCRSSKVQFFSCYCLFLFLLLGNIVESALYAVVLCMYEWI